ncbi:hypothetical protein Micbo1qcDRAFT_166553 [Microdochium bolleyi]|uniref:Uncharacterized protein n=1 Tax=Microdochium bolleyi TaxID=196109 RepID=A0A136IUN1_9PEZI|nr:hypothetical protein Micbo1qcDRAFT_166553 [Microdochium bolleyi]
MFRATPALLKVHPCAGAVSCQGSSCSFPFQWRGRIAHQYILDDSESSITSTSAAFPEQLRVDTWQTARTLFSAHAKGRALPEPSPRVNQPQCVCQHV